MTRMVFRPSPAAIVYTTLLVAGLLVFVWLHWRGQRQVELIVFMILTLLATTLYTIRGELSLSTEVREIAGRRTWLGIPLRKTVVRLGADDTMHLTEDLTHNKGGQGVGVSHRLEASGELISQQTSEPGPYILLSESYIRNRAMLEDFAHSAARSLDVSLHDSRKFTERVARYKQDQR